jgi:predicted nicotinamide N-methyase
MDDRETEELHAIPVLSDVHVGCTSCDDTEGEGGDYNLHISRFRCVDLDDADGQSPAVTTSAAAAQHPPVTSSDADGDLLLRRRKKRKVATFNVSHSMSTTIPDVGLQVWAGALLMADFICNQEWRGKAVLELGAGTGLSAAVAAKLGATVLCTDIGDEVLRNCCRTVALNTNSNSNSVKGSKDGEEGGGGCGVGRGGDAAVGAVDGPIRVRWFDWFNPSVLTGNPTMLTGNPTVLTDASTDATAHTPALAPTAPPAPAPAPTLTPVPALTPSPTPAAIAIPASFTTSTSSLNRLESASVIANAEEGEDLPAAVSPSSEFAMTEADTQLFREEVEVLLAADVVYVDSWTSAFANAAHQLLTTPPPPTNPSLRRKLYLTIEKRVNFTLTDLAPAAPAYEHFAEEMVKSSRFVAVRLPIDFPQRFPGYCRVAQLELWQFTAAAL